VVALLAAAGCGKRDDLPPLGRVSGKVTLDAKPLPRGTVQFIPDDPALPVAVGYIDSEGRYTMSTRGTPGAPAGGHTAVIDAREEVDLNKTSWARSLIPERYNNVKTSKLPVQVKADSDNQVDLALTAKKK
jgi:hypothetical protein